MISMITTVDIMSRETTHFIMFNEINIQVDIVSNRTLEKIDTTKRQKRIHDSKWYYECLDKEIDDSLMEEYNGRFDI